MTSEASPASPADDPTKGRVETGTLEPALELLGVASLGTTAE